MADTIGPPLPKNPASAVAAVVLAAGRSRRMGRCKLTLPWGDGTVIERVVHTLYRAGARPVLVVTAPPWHALVLRALQDTPARVTVYHPQHPEAMLLTLQWGLRHLPEETRAALVALGDQPHIPPDIPQRLIQAFQETGAPLLAPVYRGRKGHPWLLARSLWPDLLRLHPRHTLRDFLHAHAHLLRRVPVNTPTILWDMDTPADYRRLQALQHPENEPRKYGRRES